MNHRYAFQNGVLEAKSIIGAEPRGKMPRNGWFPALRLKNLALAFRINFSRKSKDAFAILALLFAVINGLNLSAQTCSVCVSPFTADTTVIKVNALDSSSIVVNQGKTLCIFANGQCTGTVTINGGVVCNKGRFYPRLLVFNSGMIINQHHAKTGAVNLGSGKSITNSHKSIFTVDGNFTVSGGNIGNHGILNVKQDFENNSGTVTNMNIINCYSYQGSNSINNQGIINKNSN